ncbi:MAG: hypothetical protein KY392_03375 [Chloroflexi bacterium]|nr:hypothetical protein [Chloroflexota bacterium]
MRRDLFACLLIGLSACVAPAGAPVPECDRSWEPVVVDGGGVVTGNLDTIAIDCYQVTGERRLQVGVTMPPGPECYAVDFVEVIEDDEAISLEVRIGTINNPLGGVCPPEAFAWGVLVELNEPVADRRVLDAATGPAD